MLIFYCFPINVFFSASFDINQIILFLCKCVHLLISLTLIQRHRENGIVMRMRKYGHNL